MSRLIYLHGFASGPTSSKAQWFKQRFRDCGIALEIPDLAGGDFEHLTISGQLRIIDALCRNEPAILFGSSLGGYLAALFAARHPEVEKLVLMAPAFGFRKGFERAFDAHALEQWRTTGRTPIFHYGEGGMRNLGYGLLEDAQRYEDFPDFRQPALILHGAKDTVVPAGLSEAFAGDHPNAGLMLLDSDHQLTDVLEPIWRRITAFLGLPAAA